MIPGITGSLLFIIYPPGRGGITERSTYLGTLSTNKTFEWLFEGGDPGYLEADVGGNPAGTLANNAGIPPTLALSQLSYSSVDSIKWAQGVNENAKTGNINGAPNNAFEFWYQQADEQTGAGITQLTGGNILLPMIGTGNNGTRYIGSFLGSIANGYKNRNFPGGGRIGAGTWECFVDTYGDDTPHQLMGLHEVGNRDTFIIMLDGVPVASGLNDPDNPLEPWDANGAGPVFNGDNAVIDAYRPATKMGSFTFYDAGEEWTIQMARQLFETSALDGHDMFTVPKWVSLDAENVTVNSYVYHTATLADVLDSTGIRSGAIPRTGKIYFEMEIVDEGDTVSASRIGIRRMISIADVGDQTDVSQDGDKHHFYVDGTAIHSDRAIDTTVTLPDTPTTGSIYGIAIDWDNGRFWFSRNGVWNSLAGGGGEADPVSGTNEVDIIDRNTNWAAHVWNNGSAGNSVVRLRSELGAQRYGPPTGFVAWTGNLVIESGGRGVNARALAQQDLGAQLDRQYLWEGDTTTYMFDSSEWSNKYYLTEQAGAITDRVLGGAQLSYASVDSVTWGRSTASAEVRNSQVVDATGAHAWELWYRQPDFAQSIAILIGDTNNNYVAMGNVGAGVNTPAARNNFNLSLFWASDIDTYGDNLPHQLMEVHDSAAGNNYFVALDGMPIASGTNQGFWGTVSGGYEFNKDLATGGLQNSGADFGSFSQYRGGVPFTLFEVRKLFEASALPGHDMMTNASWCFRDGVNVTGSAPSKDVTMGDTLNDTGLRSFAIPRNGKVYFEIEIIGQGDDTASNLLGLRKLTEPSNVGFDPATATDEFHTNGAGDVEDGQDNSLGITGTLGTAATGRIFQIAIDWDTGKWWLGTDDTLWAGVGGTGNPSSGANPLSILDVDTNWACSNRANGAAGNGVVRLITADVDLNYTKPTSYVAWEDAI